MFWLASLLMLLIAAGIGAGVYVSAKRSVTQDAHDHLESIARLRAANVGDWLGGVRKNVDMALDVPWFTEELNRWIAEGAPASARQARLLGHLQAIASGGLFRDLSIRSGADGAVLLSTDPALADLPTARALALKAVTDGGSILDDLHHTDAGRPGLGLSVYRAFGPGAGAQLPHVAQVALDPAVSLFPLLNQWPGRSASAEILLFRVDGKHIVYLNHSRHQPEAALELRRPVDAADVSAKAVGGALGAQGGSDYRGVKSLAYILPVAGTPWFLIAKIDEGEALADLDRMAQVVTGGILFLIVLVAWWKTERWRRREAEYRALLDRSLLTRRIEFLARYANDGIVLADTDGRIIEVNRLCAEIYGYAREEMFGMPIGRLWAAPAAAQDRLCEEDVVYEAEHWRKDGSPIAVEVSSRMIDIDGGRYFQAIVRDNRQRKQYEMSLRQSEERFRLTFDHAPIGMLMQGLDGRILAVNAACCLIFGYRQAELLTMTLGDATHPDERLLEAGWLNDLRTSETSNRTVERRIVHKDRRVIHVSITRSLVRDVNGEPLHAVAQIHDVTEQRESAARIERLSQLKAALSEVNHALLHSQSAEDVFHAVCRACVERGGFRLAWVGIVDPALEQVVPAAVCGPAAAYLEGAIVSSRADVPANQLPSAMIALGTRHYLCNDFFMDPVFVPWRDRAYRNGIAASICVELRRGGEPYGTLSAYGGDRNCFDGDAMEMLDAMADNISFAIDRFDHEAQRLRAEADLRLSERKAVHDVTRIRELEVEGTRQADRLRQMSHQMVAVQEEERRRLASDLQDRASPNLAAIKLTLGTLTASLPAALPPAVEACVEDARALLDDTIMAVREISADLRPSVLDYAGLIPALVGYSEQYTRRTGIAVRLQLPPDDVRFGAEIESTLFRIVQEALINAARHSNAGRVDVAIVLDGQHTVLTIEDDGIGFDLSAQRRKGDGASRGLVAMRDRAEFYGAVFDVRSTPGKGTGIRVEFATPTDTSDSPRHRFPGLSAGHTLQ